jgi:type III restriction enzyme
MDDRRAEERETIDRLIINSPYNEPSRHWRYNRERRTFSLVDGRRPAGYVVASERSKAFDDPGVFIEIPLVNAIRPRVKAWREAGYPGVTSVSKRLLEHWNDPEQRHLRFFFCQIEAIETLIWLVEAAEAEKTGLDIPGDGGPFRRLCSKMATGSGKTIVMAMLIAWQVINKVTYPQDTRFAKNVFVVAPGLTVKSRLSVLGVSAPGNYYEVFDIVPPGLKDKLRQGKVRIENWHTLNWESAEQIGKKRSVDKRGPLSDEAYARSVLGDMAGARNFIVINDEAHHAWRVPAESKVKGVSKADIEEATKWVGGLDRLHTARGILGCFDFSATPFAPSGKKSTEEALFGWIVSDFGLNDAIESGLVKTPRVVVRDDALPDSKTYRSRLYHIYNDPEVRDDLFRRARPEDPLPDLVTNAYYLLGFDWRETLREWKGASIPVPPVMITVANRTETAARIKYAFDHRKINIEELGNPERILHIDSRVLAQAESVEEPVVIAALDEDEGEDEDDGPVARPLTRKEQAELLRRQVDTVGKVGEAGQYIQNVISVGMLSEGWDAKTVTHIMGLRAFSSQLLCEQVVGRGLRRTSYDVDQATGLFAPEYVNIFGVPFTFLPHETTGSGPPRPPVPTTAIEPDPKKEQYVISWPHVIRIDTIYRPLLALDWDNVRPLELNAAQTAKIAEMAPVLEGKPDLARISEIDLEQLAREFRLQRIVFSAARDIMDLMRPTWPGSREELLGQLVRLVEQFIKSDRIIIKPAPFAEDDLRRRLIITLNMTKIVQHIWEAIRYDNAERRELVLDQDRPVRTTGDLGTWYTAKPCEYTKRSHINFCVYDSTWEAGEAFQLDRHPAVTAWVKNEHIGFNIYYVYRGVVRRYYPDFIARLANGEHLVLETKGRDDDQNRTKRTFLNEWVEAVNEDGRFGRWRWAVSFEPGDIVDILAEFEPNSLEKETP